MDKAIQQLIRKVRAGDAAALPFLDARYTRLGGKRCPCPECLCVAKIATSDIFCDDCSEEHWPHEDWTDRTLDMCKCRWCDIPIYRPTPWNHNEYYLELHANHTLLDINLPEGQEFDYDVYDNLVSYAVEEFQDVTGIDVQIEGRGGRHICVADTLENRDRYQELKEFAVRLEKQVIENITHYYDSQQGPNISA